MINPDTFHTLPDEVSENIFSMQNWAIQKIASDIKANNSLSGTSENLFDAIQRTNAFGIDFKEQLAIMTEKSLVEIDLIFEQAVKEAYLSDKTAYEITKTPMLKYENNEYLKQLTRAMSDQTKQTFKNLTQTRALGFTDKQGKFVGHQEYLQSRLQQVEFNVVNGVESYDSAIKRVVGEMVNSGLKYADYESGHRDTIEVATRRAVLTGITQLAAQVSIYNTVQLGARHVQVSRHTGARTGQGLGDIADHSAFQGRIYGLSDEFFIEFANGQIPPPSEVTEIYLDFITYCGYGDILGINGIHCRHFWNLYFPQYQTPFYTEAKLKELNEAEAVKKSFTYIDGRGHKVTKEFDLFDASQELRRRERLMRRDRSLAAGYKAGGNMDEYNAVKARLKTARAEYQRFIDEMNKSPLVENFTFTNQLQSRVYVDGLGKV